MFRNPGDVSKRNLDATAYAWTGHENALPPIGFEFLKNLQSIIGGQLARSKAVEHDLLAGLQGCLTRLSAVLLQISRMSVHADVRQWRIGSGLPGIAEMPPGSALIISAEDACADYESLMFHSRAALDRLTFMVSSRYGSNSDRFSRLPNILRDATNRDARAAKVHQLLLDAHLTGGVLAEEDSRRSLRSIVTHRASIIEGVSVVFTLQRLENGQYLAFDCEAFGYPILATSQSLATSVPFLVLNTVATYLQIEDVLPLESFQPNWNNLTTSFTQHIDLERKGPLVAIGAKMISDGVQLRYEHLKPEVLKFGFELENEVRKG